MVTHILFSLFLLCLFQAADLRSVSHHHKDSQVIRVSDFGCSKRLMTTSAASKGFGRSAHGTIHWSAPELAQKPPESTFSMEEPQNDDLLSDVYSLGVVLWELGTRKSPNKSG